MSCPRLQPELVAYHFGIVSDECRRELEAHLLSCTNCLRTYLAIKRDIETAESGPRPSPAARQRLHKAVAEELGIVEPRRKWSWWERPLAFGFAGLAVFLAIFAVGMLAAGGGSMPHGLLESGSHHRPVPAQRQ